LSEPGAAPQRPTADDLDATLRVLRALISQPDLCLGGDPHLNAVRDNAARLLRTLRTRQKQEGRDRDRDLLDAAGIRTPAVPTERPETPDNVLPLLSAPRRCYVCKESYTRRHPFYDSLCPPCGDFNFAKREQTADLTGRTALVTGTRIKIGYQTTLKLLRAGADVLGTTRFPNDAARRFAAEPDFAVWGGRLRLFALDLRHLPAVEQFATALAANLDRLDVVINNAAQTIRRPPAFYRHLLDAEGGDALPAAARALLGTLTSSPSLSGPALDNGVVPVRLAHQPLLPLAEADDPAYFPPGWYDGDGQQVDLRPHNSWSSELGEIAPAELLEVHAVNCLAPFLLLRRLEPLLFRAKGSGKYVVNVSAMEGQLNAVFKTGRHPHTNMAKAALNMLTRTCAGPYAARGVFLNSVDTGWITNEAPQPHAVRMAEAGFREPLDVVDGAARVLDPVFVGVTTGRNESGLFLKDYRSVSW
jgi:NAD(P)-dependent dehydrogenase (short-subunit alcohol dehydrogenase family)